MIRTTLAGLALALALAATGQMQAGSPSMAAAADQL
jgi:hypothetical protein